MTGDDRAATTVLRVSNGTIAKIWEYFQDTTRKSLQHCLHLLHESYPVGAAAFILNELELCAPLLRSHDMKTIYEETSRDL